MSGPTRLVICRVNPGSHLAVSGLSTPSLLMSSLFPASFPQNQSMVLSKKENVISAGRSNMSDTVLVTGGFGLVGSATVRRLAADGRRVVIADLETPAN